MITDINQLDLEKSYTYSDYLTWQFDEMVELIRGKIFKMSPAPNLSHQKISSNLHGMIWQYLKGKTCQSFHAPFDVRLSVPPPPENITTVVQPDICVVCDESKLDTQGCNGAPDWIIEILSPATARKDLNEKFDIYENAGVKEYWVVYPTDGSVVPFRLNKEGKYETVRTAPFSVEDEIQVGVFPDLVIDLKEVFNF